MNLLLAYKGKALTAICGLVVLSYAAYLLKSPELASNNTELSAATAHVATPNTTAGSSAASLNLFGKFTEEKTAIDATALPQTSLNLELAGVIGSTLLHASRCLIAESGKPAKSYSVGDKVAGDVVVYRIDKDAIILKRGETMEKLELHHGGSGPGQSQQVARRLSPTAAITETASTAAPIANDPAKPVYKDLEDRIAAIRKNSKI